MNIIPASFMGKACGRDVHKIDYQSLLTDKKILFHKRRATITGRPKSCNFVIA
jgi:hypothetical protein